MYDEEETKEKNERMRMVSRGREIGSWSTDLGPEKVAEAAQEWENGLFNKYLRSIQIGR